MSEALNPQQLSKEGKAAYQRGAYLDAAQVYQAASQAYAAGGDALNAAEMANNCSVAFLQAGDAQAALQIVEGTAETFAASGDTRRQAMALGNLGAALEALNRLDEAAAAYQQSADLLQQVGEDQMRVYVMQSLSTLQLRTGRQLEALATMQAGLEDVKKPTPKQRLLKRLLQFPSRLMNR